MVVWMEVSKDKYELPVVVADSAEELAKKCGAKISTVMSIASMHNTGRTKGRFCKYRRVKIS